MNVDLSDEDLNIEMPPSKRLASKKKTTEINTNIAVVPPVKTFRLNADLSDEELNEILSFKKSVSKKQESIILEVNTVDPILLIFDFF